MSDEQQQFKRLQARISAVVEDDQYSDRAVVAALAFQLYVALAAMPDDFMVAGTDDGDIDRENAWTQALDALYEPYLPKRDA